MKRSLVRLLPSACIFLFSNVAGALGQDVVTDAIEWAVESESSSYNAVKPSLRGNGDATKIIPDLNEESSEYQEKEEIVVAQRKLLKELIGYGGTPPGDRYPLQECEGDCDRDSDCDEAIGLFCLQRDANDGPDVPGCDGTARSRTDYCILKPELRGADFVTGGASVTSLPTSPPTDRPTGPPTSPPSFGPTHPPTSPPTPLPTSPPTRPPTNYPTVSAQPSVSHQPTESLEPTGPPSMTPTMDSFRLRIYWEEGYLWQDNSFEYRWCMMYNYDGTPGPDKCWYGTEVQPCNTHQVYVAKCQDSSDPYNWVQQQQFRFHFVNNREVTAYDDEVQIVTAGHTEVNSGKCLERIERMIFLRPCDESNSRQRWYAIRGDFMSERFEISQRTNRYFYDQCVNQAHHPKAGEVFELQPCNRARSPEHSTSFFMRYENGYD